MLNYCQIKPKLYGIKMLIAFIVVSIEDSAPLMNFYA